MGLETQKALTRRWNAGYFDKYLVGQGIDIGCGADKLTCPTDGSDLFHCDGWDIEQGNAQYMIGVPDNHYDFCYSSHCLEHLYNPIEALINWKRITRVGGYIFVAVPSEDLYEQGVWPSRGNGDHKTTWTEYKEKSWSPVSVNIKTLPYHVPGTELIFCNLEDSGYDYDLAKRGWIDQSGSLNVEVAYEFCLKKI